MADIPDRGPQLKAINIFFLVVTLVAILLRSYVRLAMVKAFGVDDYLMVLATVFFCLYIGFSTVGITYGTGRHRADLELENYQLGMRCWWFCYLFYALTMIISKVSIGCFLMRLITKRLQKWIVYGAMFISALAGIVFFIVTIFQCAPVSYFWNEEQPGTCIPPDVIIGLAIIYSVFSCISDLTFAILPGFLVWSLKMKLRTKLALVPLLAMGAIASCAVIARFPYLFQIRSPDFLWATTDIAIWSTVEMGLTITAASLATIRPLMKHIGYRMGWTTKSTSAGPSGYYGATSGRYGNSSHVRKGSTLGALNTNEAFKLSSTGSAVRSPAVKSPMSPWSDKQAPLSPWNDKQQQLPSSPLHREREISSGNDSNSDNHNNNSRIPPSSAAESHDGVRYVIQSPVKAMRKKSSKPNFGNINTSEEELRRPSTSQEL